MYSVGPSSGSHPSMLARLATSPVRLVQGVGRLGGRAISAIQDKPIRALWVPVAGVAVLLSWWVLSAPKPYTPAYSDKPSGMTLRAVLPPQRDCRHLATVNGITFGVTEENHIEQGLSMQGVSGDGRFKVIGNEGGDGRYVVEGASHTPVTVTQTADGKLSTSGAETARDVRVVRASPDQVVVQVNDGLYVDLTAGNRDEQRVEVVLEDGRRPIANGVVVRDYYAGYGYPGDAAVLTYKTGSGADTATLARCDGHPYPTGPGRPS